MRDEYAGEWDPNDVAVQKLLKNNPTLTQVIGVRGVVENFTGGARAFEAHRRETGLYADHDGIEFNRPLFSLIIECCREEALMKYGSIRTAMEQMQIYASEIGIDPVEGFEKVKTWLISNLEN